MNSRSAIVIFFVLVWAGVTGSAEPANLVFGLLLGLVALWLVREEDPDAARVRPLKVLGLVGLFVWELLKSGVRVAAIAIRPNLNLHSAVIAYPLTVDRDFEITLLANLITLTPGTLSVDVSADRRLLYIHCIDVEDHAAVIADIRQGFESKILEAFR
jgi:multicomponent Na+:H+ antiporter subunit E